jgi:outer membrane protein assembly factor BamB
MRHILRSVFAVAVVTVAVGAQSTPANERLWEAARSGDTAAITAALTAGADVNAKARYDVTPLLFAASSGRLEAARLLIARGATVRTRDTFYRAEPVDMALTNGHVDVAIFLLQNGAGADDVLAMAVQTENTALFQAALKGVVTRAGLEAAIAVAERSKRVAFLAPLKTALAATAAPPPFAVPAADLAKFAGTYRDAAGSTIVTVTLANGVLTAVRTGQPALQLTPVAENVFSSSGMTATFAGRAGTIESLTITAGPQTLTLPRSSESAVVATAPVATPPAVAPAAPSAAAASASAPAARPEPRNWAAFRGTGSTGNADGQRAVTEWDVATGRNIKWRTAVPGMAVSSPIVWGSQVFVTTAIGAAGDNAIRTGLYGDVKPVDDLSRHEWKILCLDKATGRVLWERTAATGTPTTKRHTKSSQASSTPVTDGTRVVASFGSAGVMVAWDMSGREQWRVNIGSLDSGWFFDPSFQWGHSSSPIIFGDLVILQADVQKGSFIAAYDRATGARRWRTERPDEISTWGTPAIARTGDGRDVLVTNGTKIRGYDPLSGKELWTLGPNSEITIGTPVSAAGLVFVTGGYPPVRPVYAIRPESTGDISLAQGQSSSGSIAWSNSTEGTYIPTPIVYRGLLFTLQVNGIVRAYDVTTGRRVIQGRVGTGGAFSASPVAADGRLFIASEGGEVFVVDAADGLAQVAKNDMKEAIIATPAISDGFIVVRTTGHVYGIAP